MYDEDRSVWRAHNFLFYARMYKFRTPVSSSCASCVSIRCASGHTSSDCRPRGDYVHLKLRFDAVTLLRLQMFGLRHHHHLDTRLQSPSHHSMDKEQPTSLAVLQDKIRDLTRERDGLKRQLAFNQEDNASLRTRYEEDLMDTRAQRDDARKHLVEKETEIDVSKQHIAASRDELQRQNKVEVEALRKEFSAERAAWKEVKAAMESEIERLKASGSGIPAAEVEALLRELDRANAENRNLQDRIDTIRVAAMPQGVSSSRSGPSPRQAKQESHNSMVTSWFRLFGCLFPPLNYACQDLDGAQDVKPRTADLTESTGSQVRFNLFSETSVLTFFHLNKPSQKPHTDEFAGTKVCSLYHERQIQPNNHLSP